MELWQLKTFRAVAETLNFTRAAERVNLTQSAVSHQIKALEDELGEPLFIRAKRGVKLTAAGRTTLLHAGRMLDEADVLMERVRGREHEPHGRVRAAAATQAFVHLFAPLFELFMQTHPGVELTFRTTVSTDQTISDILDGKADVGFASLSVSSPQLQVTELFQDELMLIAGKEHRLAQVETVNVAELENERLILFERGASVRRATDDFFRQVGFRPESALESNDTYFIKLMVEKGWGLSLLPAWAVREEVEAGRLAQIRLTGHRLRRTIAMVSLSQFQPSATRAFIEFVLRHKVRLQTMAEE